MSLVVDNLYSFGVADGLETDYAYIINNNVYHVDLERGEESVNDIISEGEQVSEFVVDPNGSQIIAISISGTIILYQQLSTGQFVELINRPNLSSDQLLNITVLEVPLPNGREINRVFQRLPLRNVDSSIIRRLEQLMEGQPVTNDIYDQILNVLRSVNPQTSYNISQSQQNTLMESSYQTLVKQLYGLPVQLPEYLIINGLRTNFIPFEQVGQMLQNRQIERYIIDPIVQPWSGKPEGLQRPLHSNAAQLPPTSPNRILTIFARDGTTYLVKAQYNQQTNQIFSPV